MADKEIIETDLDTLYEDIGQGSIYPFDPTDTVLEMAESPFSVYEYLRRLKQGKIVTQPDFQRNLVWNNEKKSRFIESILLNFPLPPIYLNEKVDGSYIIIDGLQRTTTLNEFYNDGFALIGLEALPALIGAKFMNLNSSLQSKFEDKKINIYNLKPSTPMVVIYDLFNRINTGGTQLNRQEVRNCIFIGKSTQILKELSEQTYFKEAIDWGVRDIRMKDREVVLRYLAFRWFDFHNEYSGDMSDYVESAMKKMNKMDDSQIEEIKLDFKRVIKWSFNIWGKTNFRIPTDYTRGTINTAILETVCNYLASKDDHFLKNNKAQIKKNYHRLIENSIYFESVTKSTGNKAKVLDRFNIAHEILNQGTQ